MSLDARLRTSLGSFELEVDLQLADGEVVALLGPNGSGKTTVVRTLCGLLPLTGGHIRSAGAVLADAATGVHLDPSERGVGVVFQEHRLFPHLDARENVAFGPRARGVDARTARSVADRWLAQVGLADRAGHRPSQLSGGQAQRVALARALATDPHLLLLDEPLAALDVDTRREVRAMLRDHLDRFPGPVLLITHDPVEALALADRLVVVEDGRVTQDGPPAEVTARPRSSWIATLVGLNLLEGDADGTRVRLPGGAELTTATSEHGPVVVLVHPRAVAVHREPPAGSPRNLFRGEVTDLDVRGDRVRVRVDGPVPLIAEITPAAVADLDLGAGGTVHLAVKATELEVTTADLPASADTADGGIRRPT